MARLHNDETVYRLMMNGKITTFFEEKGFGFIKDEDGENRYFHICKVSNPDAVKVNALVTFEPGTNNKGLSAFSVKVVSSSKHIIIANEKIKTATIKSFRAYTKDVPAEVKVDKENIVLSIGLLMNKIRPQDDASKADTKQQRVLDIVTFQNETHTFTEDEIDIDEALDRLKKL